MILVRLVFQAKFGKAGQLASEMAQMARGTGGTPGAGNMRVLTDLSGQFDTVVLEVQAESLGAWEQQRAQTFSSPEFTESARRTSDLIESGRTEFYTIEA